MAAATEAAQSSVSAGSVAPEAHAAPKATATPSRSPSR